MPKGQKGEYMTNKQLSISLTQALDRVNKALPKTCFMCGADKQVHTSYEGRLIGMCWECYNKHKRGNI
jgi:hypothetical protein